MEDQRVYIDEIGRMYRIKETVPLSEPPNNLRIARTSKPWATYRRMLGTVIPAFFLMYVFLFLVIGLIRLEPGIVLLSGLCSAPLVFFILSLHKPRLVHVQLAVPDEMGSEAHAISPGVSLRTPMRTKFSRFLVKDDSILDVPPNRQLWGIFSAVILVGASLSAMLYSEVESLEVIAVLAFILIGVPIWFIGFSLPVLAWWGTSNKLLGLPTRRRDAEAWLMAGMASAFPAFIFNSLIAPEIIPFDSDYWTEFSLLAVGAPFCEEIFKAMAVALFLPYIKGPKHGFQVGFTVGLGFALIENFQYIGFSLLGGPVGLSFTILVRGIGSIPGHAVWTAISGTAIGWMATDKELKAKLSWKARSMAISAIDIAEGIGIDTDGDGDLSGFDGSRLTLEEAVNQASTEIDETKPWMILGQETDEANVPDSKLGVEDFSLTYEKNTITQNNLGIHTPRGVAPALALSIAGHSFWNGSSFLSFSAAESLGIGELGSTLAVLSWIIILICSVLFVARGVIRGVNSLE
ncbi:MAG: PrsW family intramembrane metalloprotease [Candidatus Thalassarchaeaceae archaeon]|nr:MAG: hypothetical protein CND84_00895 [Marine Group II euryarchaeote MED-G35]